MQRPYIYFRMPKADFVLKRGMLTKILRAPYDRYSSLEMAIVLFKGTYFIQEIETQEKKTQKESMTPRQREMALYGWNFEQHLTTSKVAVRNGYLCRSCLTQLKTLLNFSV